MITILTSWTAGNLKLGNLKFKILKLMTKFFSLNCVRKNNPKMSYNRRSGQLYQLNKRKNVSICPPCLMDRGNSVKMTFSVNYSK